MFKNAYQSGFLSILYSIGSKPLQIWDKNSIIIHYFSSKWSYQETHRSGYPIFGVRDHGNQHHNCLYHMPRQLKVNTRNQAPILGYDHQKCNIPINAVKKIFYI